MTQNSNLATTIAEIGGDYKTLNNKYKLVAGFLNANASDLAALGTVEKGNIVVALNEVLSIANAAATTGYSHAEADTRVQLAKGSLSTPANDKWASTAEIISEFASLEARAVTKAVDEITAGAGDAFQTLKKIQDDLEGDQTVLNNLMAAVNKRVAVDKVQEFTLEEKRRACENLGIGDPSTDFLSAYRSARDAA